ncbi:MAG: bifunctional demethylmenaquinone methyltransferase/2-methoxy-6-polyprenyl-1,4-benzoquinol methylase UbiE [Epsilonproteobacteria bacterium]|nr:bifunctional demethylmenaquinone methyltransferase/2-methoxy-6-polyprenyl-1,4-benzoquinol methylase UbiE [Campylobacterota bacterium]NPA56703.1 bifunctional demethylmenaquinone methyltransferase/2-methoxy-6-polyprenyl-1,4-benzoquinol methylase UbiE [Campylobacterota bacterium]
MDSRQRKIVSMFDEIAKSYDLANRILSFGTDVVWRKRACQRALDHYGRSSVDRIVDVACGTGDMLLHWEREARRKGVDVREFIGIDPSEEMLKIARTKLPHFTFIKAYAQEIPLESGSSDLVSITYGIRNVVERVEALREFHRILKPGGIVVILEFTKRNGRSWLDPVVELYMKRILPIIGGLVSGKREAYEYLPNSIDSFLTTDQLVEELRESGFRPLEVRSFSWGISTMFIAERDGEKLS